jgi:hypothetical protein
VYNDHYFPRDDVEVFAFGLRNSYDVSEIPHVLRAMQVIPHLTSSF